MNFASNPQIRQITMFLSQQSVRLIPQKPDKTDVQVQTRPSTTDGEVLKTLKKIKIEFKKKIKFKKFKILIFFFLKLKSFKVLKRLMRKFSKDL